MLETVATIVIIIGGIFVGYNVMDIFIYSFRNDRRQ